MLRSFGTIIFMGLLLLCGCSKKVEKTEVIGMWVANFGTGTNFLDLRLDGTYVHGFYPQGSTGVSVKNKWEFEYWDGEPLITFYGYSAEPSPGAQPEAFWPAKVSRSGKKLIISTDADLRREFVKKL